jgi:hypothetical protein
MSSRKANHEWSANDALDGLIRWAIRDSVADQEPSPDVWECIQQSLAQDYETVAPRSRFSLRIAPPRALFAWLVGAGADFPVPGDPRLAWQRRLCACDVRATQSIVRLAECTMPALRMVA